MEDPFSTNKKKKKEILLLANDTDIPVKVEEDVASQSILISRAIHYLRVTDPGLPLLKKPFRVELNSWLLRKILLWCTMHRGKVFAKACNSREVKLTYEDEKYLNVNSKVLVALLNAAEYLQIQGIINIVNKKISNGVNIALVLRELLARQEKYEVERSAITEEVYLEEWVDESADDIEESYYKRLDDFEKE